MERRHKQTQLQRPDTATPIPSHSLDSRRGRPAAAPSRQRCSHTLVSTPLLARCDSIRSRRDLYLRHPNPIVFSSPPDSCVVTIPGRQLLRLIPVAVYSLECVRGRPPLCTAAPARRLASSIRLTTNHSVRTNHAATSGSGWWDPAHSRRSRSAPACNNGQLFPLSFATLSRSHLLFGFVWKAGLEVSECRTIPMGVRRQSTAPTAGTPQPAQPLLFSPTAKMNTEGNRRGRRANTAALAAPLLCLRRTLIVATESDSIFKDMSPAQILRDMRPGQNFAVSLAS